MLGYHAEYFRYLVKSKRQFTVVRDQPAKHGVRAWLLRDEIEIALSQGNEALQKYRKAKGRIK